MRPLYKRDRAEGKQPSRQPPRPMKHDMAVFLPLQDWITLLRWIGPLEKGQAPDSVVRSLRRIGGQIEEAR